MSNGQKTNGQWDTKTKFLKKKKSRSRLLREKREYMRRKRIRIKILKHGFSSREIQMGRAVARLRIEMAKPNPIDARIWIYAYSAFVDAIEILNQHNRMLRLERKKEKSRLFMANHRQSMVTLPTGEKKIRVMNSCDECNSLWFADSIEVCKCKR